MIDRKILTTSLATLILTLTGCPSPSGGPVPLEALPQRIADAQCAHAARCGTGSLAGYEQYVLREELTDCSAQIGAFLQSTALGAIRAGVADGSILYHADTAGACVASYEAAPCAGVPIDAACLEVFEGTIADGAPCSNSEQCGSESSCDSSGAGMCPSGVCVHLPQIGEACETSCALDARCSSGTCVALAGPGAPCSLSEGSQCEAGLTCVTAPGSSSGTCGTSSLAGLGEACGSGCESGLVCSGVTGMCRQPRTDGTCERTLLGADDCGAGEECILVADGTSGECGPLPTAGEPCTTICARGSRCSASPGSPGVCTVSVAVGGACEADGMCASGYCDSGVCADRPLCIES